jgi:hypothetical protein
VEQLHVDVSGLATLASCCSEQALVVRATGFAPEVTSAFASTGAAVTVMHDVVFTVSQKISGQLESTGAESREAARGFETDDADNALSLRRPDRHSPGSAQI